ncbi:hypothetical protein MMC12_004953 [Toensbergia leucococca]|nr:hypothetical protein [Toensbergia leucococca]
MTEDYELHTPVFHTSYQKDSRVRGRTPFTSDRENLIHTQDHFDHVASHEASLAQLGKPKAKKRVHGLNVLAAGISLICLVLAITAVASESLSWRLGLKNYQLIVVGFLLSIMNLSLGSVAPTLFLLLEARFGSSTLQNYDGIIRNQLTSSRLGLIWRLVLGLMLALPLGLSAAYKNFPGGESAIKVNATNSIGNASYYGMFAPPGLQSLGEQTGISLFFNATLPFVVASSSQTDSEPPLPVHAHAYGFNTLLLNNESAAMLDIPQPSYVSAVQSLLATGESWNVTATVFATVATFNHSMTSRPRAAKSYFDSFCESAEASSGAYTHASMMNDWAIELLDHASPGDQSLQYVGITPDPGIDYTPSCSAFYPYARPFDINRQLCKGTWTITRGGIQLNDGSCNGTILPPEKEQVITNNTLFLGVWYMYSLVEFLGPFATTRNESRWMSSYMATGMAAMLWSRITVIDSVANLANSNSAQRFAGLTYEDAGLIYPVNDTVVHTRPTLQKSGWLYCVFAIQPLMVVIILGLTWMFHSTPLDKDFGLISILSGVDRGSLDILAGAALSGELVRNVKLVIHPTQENQKGTIEYYVALPSTAPMRNGRLTSQTIYH